MKLARFTLLLVLMAVLSAAIHGTGQFHSLEEGFKNPPHNAKPKTWFHVMSGNMSAAGLTKDLEAIEKVGIGGILLFNVTHTIPKGNVLFNSKKHQELIAHAANECERLGLSFGVHNCDGWTSSGGPWVTPENSMKMVSWSEQIVPGGKTVDVELPRPSARNGFYKGVAVVAYPSLPSELTDEEAQPKVTSSDPDFDADRGTDGPWDEKTVLHATEEEKGWVQFDFGRPFTPRSLFMSLTKRIAGSRKATFLKSDNGTDFEKIDTYDLKRMGKREFAIEEYFAEQTARYFRVEIESV